MAGEYGMDETKDVVKCGIELAEGIILSVEDDKVTIGDAVHFAGFLTSLPAAIVGINMVPKQVGEMDAEEAEELRQFVIDEFGIPDEKAEEIGERGIALLVDAYKLGLLIKEYKR